MSEILSHSRSPPSPDNTLYSVLGSLSILSGLAAAIASIPDEPRQIGAMFWPALWLTFGLFLVPILRVRRSIASALRAENFLMLALVYWLLLDMLRSAYPLNHVTYESVVMAMTAIGVTAIGIWVGVAGTGQQPPRILIRATQTAIDDSKLFMAAWIAFVIGMFHFVWSSGFDLSVMIKGLSLSRFSAPWSRGALGDWTSFIDQMVYFGYVLPSLTVLLANRKGWIQPRVIVSAVLSFIMVLFLMQSGGRRIIGVVIGAALLTWVLMQGRLRPRLVISVAVIMVFLVVAMGKMLEYRQIGFGGWLRGEKPQEAYSTLHVDDNFLRLSQVTAIFPDTVQYVGLQSLVYILVRPIPRVFWPGKPVNAGYDLPTLIGLRGSGNTSLSQSIVGELYVMYGLIAVFLGGVFLGRLSSMWNRLIDMSGGPGKPLVCGLGIMILFASVRSMQDLVILSYALFAWLLVSAALGWRKGSRGVRAKGF